MSSERQPPHLVSNILVFGRLLRRLGLDVHTGRLLDLIAALEHVNVGRRDEVYHTCRTLLLHRHEDLAIFDRAFDAFWREPVAPREGPAHASTGHELAPAGSTLVEMPGGDERDGDEEEPPEAEQELRTWSDVTALAAKDFAEFSGAEVALARAALDRLTWTPGQRRTRRWVAGRGTRIDVRRGIARSRRTGGDVVTLPRERRRRQPRPLVLVCDVSGSMERYTRILLHFAHALSRRHTRTEVFLFSTRLTRVTMALRSRGIDAAVGAVSKSVHDWSSGTRTGDALRELNKRWSRRVLVRGPVVLLISDGWDRGDPGVLRQEVARLQRSCHRLIWLNPLIGTADYAPLTRGLQAALPFVDDFLPVRTLTDLSDLAVHLNGLAGRR